MAERWRKVRRADGYKVSSEGRARSVDRTLADGRQAGGVMLTPTLNQDGYPQVTINGETVLVMHLVLEAFDRPRPYGMEACHAPEAAGRQDSRLAVLRWGTHRENERDKKRASQIGNGEFRTSPQEVGTPGTGDLP
jgi:NUMOD4 motif-containing protein